MTHSDCVEMTAYSLTLDFNYTTFMVFRQFQNNSGGWNELRENERRRERGQFADNARTRTSFDLKIGFYGPIRPPRLRPPFHRYCYQGASIKSLHTKGVEGVGLKVAMVDLMRVMRTKGGVQENFADVQSPQLPSFALEVDLRSGEQFAAPLFL